MTRRLIPARIRSYPHVEEHNWLIHDALIEFLGDTAQRYAQGVLVDIGCGTKPYAPLFAPHVVSHIGVDLADSPHGCEQVDVVGTAYETTLTDCSADVILCSEVLEHLEEPGAAFTEFHRVLKPGGVLLLTTPFIWPIHEQPRDFYRYTEYGLRYLSERAKLDVLDVRPLGGFVRTSAQMLATQLHRYRRFIILRPFLSVLVFTTLWLAKHLTPLDRGGGFVNVYGLVARKASGEALQ